MMSQGISKAAAQSHNVRNSLEDKSGDAFQWESPRAQMYSKAGCITKYFGWIWDYTTKKVFLITVIEKRKRRIKSISILLNNFSIYVTCQTINTNIWIAKVKDAIIFSAVQFIQI